MALHLGLVLLIVALTRQSVEGMSMAQARGQNNGNAAPGVKCGLRY